MPGTDPLQNQSPKTGDSSVWPVEGSTCYYALRHCPQQVQHHIHAVRQLINSVGYCLLEVSEPSVAEKKIHWWHEEIARLAAAEPRHPDTKHYLPFFSQLSAAEQQQASSSLLTVLSCHSEEKFNTMEDQESFEELLLSDGRARQCLMSLAHLKSTESASAIAQNDNRASAAGEPVHFMDVQARNSQSRDTTERNRDREADVNLLLGLGLFHRLASFHKLYHAGLPVWPDSLYKQYNLSPENIKQSESTENLLNLQSDLFDQAITRLDQTRLSSIKGGDESPRWHPDARLATAIYAAIRQAQLRVWKKHRTNLLAQYRTVTPLKKAWICWRLQHQLRAKS